MRPPFPVDQPTVRHGAGQPRLPHPPLPQSSAGLPRRAQPRPPRTPYGLIAVIGGVTVLLLTLVLAGLGAAFVFAGERALPGAAIMGVPVGGLPAAAIADQLRAPLTAAVTADAVGLSVPLTDLGITLNADASAAHAVRSGRTSGGLTALFAGLTGRMDVPAVLTVDGTVLAAALTALAPQVETPAVDAGLTFNGGAFLPRPAVIGRRVDVAATVEQVLTDPAAALLTGTLPLIMVDQPPALTDPTPLVQAAAALLAAPLTLTAYDPIADRADALVVPPETWGAWLTGTPDPAAPLGVAWRLDTAGVADWLNGVPLPDARTIRAEEAAAALQTALTAGISTARVRLYHEDTSYTVQPGDTLISIAYAYGMPYPYLQQANPGVDALSPGQTIVLPSRDRLLPLPIVDDRRIVVSIPDQRVRVYEAGALLWDWSASTGITSSPTWPGVYQILSHEPNAYAGNWDLWMPNFMGVYQPIPGADFTNGFHGFPTRAGWQLLWQNDLGRRVTYGCILLGDTEIAALYDWATAGTIVEIQG